MSEIDPKVRLVLKELVMWEIGVHPAAIVENGVTTERDRYGDGWNDALDEVHKIDRMFFDWYKSLPDDAIESITELLLSEELQLAIGEDGSGKDVVKMYINANDTFSYACADAVGVEMSEVGAISNAYKQFKRDGVLAWMSIKEKAMPIEPLQTDGFKKAYDALKGVI